MSRYQCTHCGYIGRRKRITQGTLLTEMGLWLLFIVPGLIYSLWRESTRYKGCPKCKAPYMIPYNPPAPVLSH